MPRAVWTGSLSFGLVSIPVALYPATQPKDVRFHLFDRQGRTVRTAASLKTRNQCRESRKTERTRPSRPRSRHRTTGADTSSLGSQPRDDDGPEAERESNPAYRDLLRGSEVEPGRFAMLESEEIEQIRPQRSSTIELEDFVDLEDIDPVFFEKSDHPSPRHGARKPYFLLQQALERTRLVGIGPLRAQDEAASRGRPRQRSCARPRDAVLRRRGALTVGDHGSRR